ncbi:SusC/RagA family TonB-linked outer membrane protein [Sphingobacterium sp. UT-1RO-CII-1]|uniref:SusC/RagA family TonB-linked outer membrane protein n=1 Tax=Sphingobacterium sp. UT-1RO-CII-1 TaxID=2995225 RepID=UPI00227CE17C|nr:SusC/RagA family TonB-linked outer membrane protein [Sphingobacterium sp. UT-1RO-CII-1]MCY4780149.1 SusC/RagA family TonB-linked outer membrane protein [Sphingobacterium sp. UT-1RO-CII-1]
MKITAFFMLVMFVHVHGSTYGQKISLRLSGATLSTVLNEIQKQAGVDFLYNSASVDVKKKISVNVKNQNLSDVLESILKEQKLDFEIDKKVVLIKRSADALVNSDKVENTVVQSRVVSGVVRDVNGQPVAGVTVSVVGTTTGTTTDTDGAYSLQVSNTHKTLSYSIVGYTPQSVDVNGRSVIDVVLEENIDDLDEVVVVGYSTQRVRYLSSAITTLNAEKLKDVTSNDLSAMLQGKAPGVVVSSGSGAPTSKPNVLIRGAGTISASTSPLIVVDGNIGGEYNPADIESVTVLRDVAATGLYGSRAANGVILVNTKRGQAGRTKVELNNSYGFGNPTMGSFKLMNSQQLYDYQTKFYNRDASVLDNDTDWWKLAFGTGRVNNHNVSVAGGGEKVQFYTSGVFFRETGTLKSTDFTGYNFRNNINAKLSDRLTAAFYINGGVQKNNLENSNTIYDAYTNLPFDPAFDSDGLPIDGRFHPVWYGRERENFLHSLQYNYNNSKDFAVNGDLNLDYKLSNKFTLSTYNRAQLYNGKTARYFDRRTKQGGANEGELYNGTSSSERYLTSNRIRYSDNFGAHNLVVLGVAEAETTVSDWTSMSGKGLPPGRDVMSVATNVLQNPGGSREQVSFRKYLMQADYNYADKYFLVGSLVNEFSSKFGKNNSTANFFQLGASWNITNEDFLKDNTTLSYAKLRGSYGTVGNADGISNFAALGLYSITQDASYAGLPGAAPYQKGNPDLSWEKIKSANLGVDLTLWNRIQVSVDVYEKKASELLYQKPLAATTGYSYVWVNAGSVRNRGLEFNITSQNVTKEKFSWETGFNMAFNRNKVLELSDGADVFNPGASQPIAVGHDMDEFHMPIWVGVDPKNGDPLWEKIEKDANGVITKTTTNIYSEAATADSRQFTGKSAAPKFTGGVSNTLKYGDFTLSAFFNFVYGNYVYNDTRVYFDSDGLYEAFNSMVPMNNWTRWEKEGDIATHPKAVVGGNKESSQTSSRFLESGSYIRLRNVRLGYNLPQNALRGTGLSRVHIFVSGDNLWTGTKFSGPDPEVSLTQIDQSSGRSSFKYPISKKFLFGVNLTF